MNVNQIIKTVVALFFVVVCNSLIAQIGGWNPKRVQDSKEALMEMVREKPRLQTYLDSSYAYVIFPKVTKGGFVLGGAFGKGVVFQKNQVVGISKLKQASWGLQGGAQQYSEVIFFEDAAAFENFKNRKLKFDAQASVVAIKLGASINAAYYKGVAVFTKTKGGLMYEASIGGQHFKYQSTCDYHEISAALSLEDWLF
ncbi:MAG: lipid-binding SYLF domain-containing protein [Paraglaciecola sp.]|jgi:lipid-binding SYLF domain-containing protein